MKPNSKIEGVVLTDLAQIKDERGAVFHVIKNDSATFYSFGEAYFSKINKEVIKGWKYHKVMKQNFCVPYGELKLVLFDDRENSKTVGNVNEIILNDSTNYKRVTIPENIWYSFKCLNTNYCLLLNIADIKHEKSESLHMEIDNDIIPYEW
ncbi:MAG: dTDP-4-dehydrorhamnose 3,5-epimerase family protein [Schleiferiaceae bacterium]|nr:dTDP-4-dehydrorhamnose 3,5-epimerase family protein [Schleiferiaceae bacterium]